ncbi:MAG: response regulator [Bacteroidota bacterium]
MRLSALLILIIFLACATGAAQPSYLANVTHLGVEEGLSHREVFEVHQDQLGFIWVGTKYGLNRYDGRSFKWWTKEEQGLASNTIHHILEDAEGWLWVLTTGHWFLGKDVEAISLINIHSGEVRSPEQRFGDSTGVDFSKINEIVADGRGGLILHEISGSNSYYHPDLGFQPIQTASPFFPLAQVAKQNNEGIWGLEAIKTGPPAARLSQISPNGQVLQSFPLEQAGRLQLFFTKRKEDFWFINTHSPEMPKLIHYRNGILKDSLDILSFNPAIPNTTIFSDWTNRLYFQPTHDFFWFKASPYLFVFHPAKGMAFNFRDQHQELIDADIQNIEFDRDGNAWICTVNGLFQVRLQADPFQRYLYQEFQNYQANNGYSCRGIWASSEQLFVNTYKGRVILNKANKQTKALSYLTTTKNGQPQHIGKLFFALAIQKGQEEDVLWYGEVSLLKRSLSTGIEQEYHWEGKSKEIWSIYEDKSGKIWLGTNTGLGYLDAISNTLKLADGLPDALKNSQVTSFMKTKREQLWLTTSSGLYKWSPEQGVVAHMLPKTNILHLHEDEAGILWLATEGSGLIRLTLNINRTQVKEQEQFTIAHGLSNNTLYAVYEDDYGQLWMSSDYGIIRFDKASNRVQTYLPNEGITHYEFNRISHFKDAAGMIYFGGLNGITAFHPKDFQARTNTQASPALRITEYQQFDGKSGQLVNRTAAIQDANQIVLQPGDRFFRLEFALLDYETPELSRYAWMIEGVDADWNYINENFIRISGLPAGNYALRVKGQSADGRWSDQELTLPLEVQEYFYKKSWFWMLGGVVALLGIILVFYWRNQRLKHRQAFLETEVKKRTATIQKQAEELRQLDRVKSRFFANVSHELRTPLTLILAPIRSALGDQQLNGRTHHYLQLAQQSGQKLLQLVNELLDLTKLEHAEIVLKEQAIVFYPLMRRITASFESWAQSNQQDFVFHYQPTQQLRIQLDVDKFEKILNNLLSNACKFTPPEGKIEVVVKELPHQLQVIVIDTGRGIHPDDIPHVFDRFYQTKRADAADEGGTGIGLALGREFAQLMQGKLYVESELGKGSSFYFEFPKKEVLGSLSEDEVEAIALAEADATTQQVPTLISIGAEGTVAKKPSILLVEDNPSLREYIQLILNDGYNIRTAENGQVALNLLQTYQPQLILSDVMMPVMDGYQLLEHLKTSDQYRHIPVIMLTARAQLRDKLKALRIGVDDYMAKPFVEEELRARMYSLLQNAAIRSATAEAKNTATKEKETPQLSAADAQWLAEQEALLQKELFHPDFSVARWATTVFLSERQLQRKIKQLTGLSPRQYILEMRLQEGRRLLEDRKHTSVAAVAYAIGFSQPQAFTRQFRKYFGRLPSEYLA